MLANGTQMRLCMNNIKFAFQRKQFLTFTFWNLIVSSLKMQFWFDDKEKQGQRHFDSKPLSARIELRDQL